MALQTLRPMTGPPVPHHEEQLESSVSVLSCLPTWPDLILLKIIFESLLWNMRAFCQPSGS